MEQQYQVIDMSTRYRLFQIVYRLANESFLWFNKHSWSIYNKRLLQLVADFWFLVGNIMSRRCELSLLHDMLMITASSSKITNLRPYTWSFNDWAWMVLYATVKLHWLVFLSVDHSTMNNGTDVYRTEDCHADSSCPGVWICYCLTWKYQILHENNKVIWFNCNQSAVGKNL